MILEMEKIRKRHRTPERDSNLPESAKVQALKDKLRLANEKIVTLLKEKIQVGQRYSPPPR